MNVVHQIGNLGKDAETKAFDSGSAVTNFSIAISKKYKNSQGDLVNHVEWVNVEYWHKIESKLINYLKKGIQVLVIGEMKTTKKEDRYYTVNKAREIRLLGGKNDNTSNANVSKSKGEDDLPF